MEFYILYNVHCIITLYIIFIVHIIYILLLLLLFLFGGVFFVIVLVEYMHIWL